MTDSPAWLQTVRVLVRPVVTLALVGAMIALTLTRLVPPEPLLSMAGIAVGFWFSERSQEKRDARQHGQTGHAP